MAERHDDIRFEKTDVSIGPVVAFLAVLSVCLAGAMGGLWLLQEQLDAGERAAKQPDRPLATTPAGLPPEPRIEGIGGANASHSVTDVDLPSSAKNQRAREEQQLATGWTDAGGKKHLPIEEAMKRIAGKYAKEKAP